MLSDPEAALAVARLAAPGFASSNSSCKGYIDASTVDAETASKVSAIVKGAGAGGFLEAPVSGSKGPAIAGQLIFLTSGDAALSEFAAPLLEVMGKKTFYLGKEVGLGAKMKLAVNALMGTMMASLAEQLSLAAASGLKPVDLLDVVALGAERGGPSREKALARFAPAFPLKHQRKDLRLALELAEETKTPLPLTKAACELFAEAQDGSLTLGDADFAAVVEAVVGKMK
jgi:glyoxylate/succinic semialdehyde reductase